MTRFDAIDRSRALPLPRLPLAAFLLLCAAALPGAAWAQTVQRFEAAVDSAQVTVGEPINFTLTLQLSGNSNIQEPAVPDWGGLQPRESQPSQQTNIQMGIGPVSIVRSWRWDLVGTKAGQFTIGKTSVTDQGKTYETKPITVTVGAAPPTTSGGGAAGAGAVGGLGNIMSAHTDDPETNKTLRDRLFLRATVSDPTPYVGEPVVITYTLFNDNLNSIGPLSPSMGDIKGAVTEELFNAPNVDYQTRSLNGKDYHAAPMYKLAVIPNKEGDLTISGYSLSGMSGSMGGGRGRNRRGGFGGGFGPWGPGFGPDPFGLPSGTPFEIPSPPVTLRVRPIPTQGQPKTFTGTVGDFKLAVKADHDHMTEDDVLGLDLTLSGRGAIELADAPIMPPNSDFERIDQTSKVEKTKDSEGIGGSKTFTWILRPKHAGTLMLPVVEYSIFDPYKSEYRVIRSTALKVTVDPGALGVARHTAGLAGGTAETLSPAYDLEYLKTIGELHPMAASPLLQEPAFWIAQGAAVLLLLLAALYDRRRAAISPAERRRQAGWRQFELRLRAIGTHLDAQKDGGVEATGELEQAVRSLIADRFNISAEGLTRPEIERQLSACAMPSDRVRRVCDLLEECNAVRYAPSGAQGSGARLREWMGEFGRLLREGLYQ